MNASAADDRRADDYAANARLVADLAADLIDWLAPETGETILDLGCGDGVLTARIGERGAKVVGVDRSPAMVAAARRRGLDALEIDGQLLARANGLGDCFDAVFSNAALHWMNRAPQDVIDAVFERLVPGGRFVAEMGAAGNIAPIRAALRAEAGQRGLDPDTLDPRYFASEDDYCDRLAAAGFGIERCRCFERPTPLPGDVSDWLSTLANPFLSAFEAGRARSEYVAAVRERLIDTLREADGRWIAPYVRLRFCARKPAA